MPVGKVQQNNAGVSAIHNSGSQPIGAPSTGRLSGGQTVAHLSDGTMSTPGRVNVKDMVKRFTPESSPKEAKHSVAQQPGKLTPERLATYTHTAASLPASVNSSPPPAEAKTLPQAAGATPLPTTSNADSAKSLQNSALQSPSAKEEPTIIDGEAYYTPEEYTGDEDDFQECIPGEDANADPQGQVGGDQSAEASSKGIEQSLNDPAGSALSSNYGEMPALAEERAEATVAVLVDHQPSFASGIARTAQNPDSTHAKIISSSTVRPTTPLPELPGAAEETGEVTTGAEAAEAVETPSLNDAKQQRLQRLKEDFKSIFTDFKNTKAEESDEEPIDDHSLHSSTNRPDSEVSSDAVTPEYQDLDTDQNSQKPVSNADQTLAEFDATEAILAAAEGLADLSAEDITAALQEALAEVFDSNHGDSEIANKRTIVWSLEDINKLLKAEISETAPERKSDLKKLQTAFEALKSQNDAPLQKLHGEATVVNQGSSVDDSAPVKGTSDPKSAAEPGKADNDNPAGEKPSPAREGTITGRMWNAVGSLGSPAKYIVGFLAAIASIFTGLLDFLYGGMKWLSNDGEKRNDDNSVKAPKAPAAATVPTQE